jgi:hypothetical protein
MYFKFLASLSLIGAISGCSSIGDFTRTQESPLQIMVTHAKSGIVESAQAIETSDRLYVSGQVQHYAGYNLPVTAHVDIQLLGKNGRILAEMQDDIDLTRHPRTTALRGRRDGFVASFPIEQSRQAVGIRVIYHLESHAKRDSALIRGQQLDKASAPDGLGERECEARDQEILADNHRDHPDRPPSVVAPCHLPALGIAFQTNPRAGA